MSRALAQELKKWPRLVDPEHVKAWEELAGVVERTADSSDPRLIDARVPKGTAGGDLAGTYPNPTLATIGTAIGPKGDGTHVPVVTIDAKGRVTALTDTPVTGAAPTGAAGGDLSGNFPNPSVVDDSHAHTAATLTGVVKTGDAAGGDLSGTYPNPSVVDDSHAHTGATLTGVVKTGDAAGGVLAGTYPNPTFAVDMATQSELDTAIAGITARPTVQDLTGATGTGPHALSGTPNKLMVMMNNLILRQVVSGPSATEFTISGANITLGHSLASDEPFVIWWWA